MTLVFAGCYFKAELTYIGFFTVYGNVFRKGRNTDLKFKLNIGIYGVFKAVFKRIFGLNIYIKAVCFKP